MPAILGSDCPHFRKSRNALSVERRAFDGEFVQHRLPQTEIGDEVAACIDVLFELVRSDRHRHLSEAIAPPDPNFLATYGLAAQRPR
jgi:hypothetical protein